METYMRKVCSGLYLYKPFQIVFIILGRIFYLNLLSNYTEIIISGVVFQMNHFIPFLRLA